MQFTNVFKEMKAQGSFLQMPCLDLERELILKDLSLDFYALLLHGFLHKASEAVLSRKQTEGPFV